MADPLPLEPVSPANDFTVAGASPAVHDAIQCVICGYVLRGLSLSGRCPECGTAVERSLRGNLLQYSSPAYLASLHRGVFLIQAAIVAQILLIVSLVFAAIGLGAAMGAEPSWLEPLFACIGLGVAAISLYGWWLFSSPDPATSGIHTGATARRVLRTVVILEAAFAIVELLLQLYAMSLRTAANPNPAAVQATTLLTSMANAALLATWFFSAMLYIRWLAPRIPNRQVDDRARLMMWLGPVLCTVGWLACGLGPLIALIMFYNLLEWIRHDIRRARTWSESSFASPAG
jgi:hypothetical protein